MDFSLEEEGEDFATVVVEPNRDDFIELYGYSERGGMRLRFSVYSHEAKELIALLQPVADRTETEAQHG